MADKNKDTDAGGAIALAEENAEGKSEVELLRECLKEQTRVAEVNAQALAQLSEAMKGLAPAAVIPPTAEEIRSAKFEKLYMLWLKQVKFKEFKHSDNVDVCQWLLQFDSTVINLASAACNVDLVDQPLRSQALEAAGTTWDDATVDQIRTAMKPLYQKREPQMSSLLTLEPPKQV